MEGPEIKVIILEDDENATANVFFEIKPEDLLVSFNFSSRLSDT